MSRMSNEHVRICEANGGDDLNDFDIDSGAPMSQAQVIGLPRMRTWDDYQAGCLATFGGGHRGSEFEAFQHGMQTVFTLLRAEFPTAETCKTAKGLLESLERIASL